jgi:hypothetical protein
VLGAGAFWSFVDFGFNPSIDARGILRSLTATGYGTALYASAFNTDNRLANDVGITETEVCVKA